MQSILITDSRRSDSNGDEWSNENLKEISKEIDRSFPTPKGRSREAIGADRASGENYIEQTQQEMNEIVNENSWSKRGITMYIFILGIVCLTSGLITMKDKYSRWCLVFGVINISLSQLIFISKHINLPKHYLRNIYMIYAIISLGWETYGFYITADQHHNELSYIIAFIVPIVDTFPRIIICFVLYIKSI